MTSPLTDRGARFRKSVYVLLILLSAAVMVGRILSVRSEKGAAPFLSANDRSRWCTVRALVDQGTYAIDDVIVRKDARGRIVHDRRGKPQRNPEWHTIDKVQHKGRDGRWHYYSSKPPLLPAILAGQYWVIRQLTGLTLAERPFYIGRTILVATNVLPLVLAFWILASLVERFGTTDWGRIFVMAAATFGTFLTTFAVTLNNHLPAAVAAMAAIWAMIRLVSDGRRGFGYFVVAGLAAAFAAANELPATSLLGLVGVALLWKSPLKTLFGYLPAAALVAAAFFGTNYLAHDDWRPPYAHRKDGRVLVSVDAALAGSLDEGHVPPELQDRLAEDADVRLSPLAQVIPRDRGLRWIIEDTGEDTGAGRRYVVVRANSKLHVRQWGDWYDFPGAYWRSGKESGVDAGEPSKWVYAFHVLLGHHGVFSLTPVWLLSAAGVVMLLRRGGKLWSTAMVAVVLSVVCATFYIALRPIGDRNYGGMTCGFRWLFWLIPLWLVVMIPAADAVSESRRGRAVALLLLAASALSAGYAVLNPWVHPWIYTYWKYLEWIQ